MEQEYIYLRDYVKILWKRKWVVIIVPVISVITTAVILFGIKKTGVSPTIYEQQATIQSGYVNTPVIEKQESFEIIKRIAKESNCDVSYEDISTNLFKVKLKSEKPDILQKLVQEYINTGNEFFSQRKKLYTDRINELVSYRQVLGGDIGRVQNLITEAKESNKDSLEIYYKTSSIVNSITKIDEEIFNINMALNNAREFEIIEISSSSSSSREKKLLISLVLGLLGGVLLAFAMENWTKPL